MTDTKKHWEECSQRDGLASVMSVRWGENESKAVTEELKTVLKRVLGAGIQVDQILELGCGIGRITEMLVKMHPGAKVIGVDMSKGMINRAKRNPILKDVAFENCKIGELPDDPFFYESDLIVSVTVLEHVIDECEFLDAIRKMKKVKKAILLAEEITDVNRIRANTTDVIRSLKDYLELLSPEFSLVRFEKRVVFEDGYGIALFMRSEDLPWRFK